MSQNQGNNNANSDVLHHSSGIRNQPGGSTQGGTGPYQRTPANYAGGPGPNANATITLHAQNGQTRQATTDANGAISDADRQWLADNGGAMPISQIPPQDKAIVGTGTGAAAQMGGDASQVGTKPLDTRPPGSFNPNNQGGQGGNQGGQGGNQGGQGGNQGGQGGNQGGQGGNHGGQGGNQGGQGGNQGGQGGNQGGQGGNQGGQGGNQGGQGGQGGNQGGQGGNQGSRGGNQGGQGGNQGGQGGNQGGQGGNQGGQGGNQGGQGGNQGGQGGNTNEEVLHHSSGIRNQPGGGMQGGTGPYPRTPANYAGGPGPNANSTITLHAQNGQTRQTTTDANGAISDADRQWLADNGGAMPISQIPPQDKAIVGTGTGAAAQMGGDASQVGTKPLDTRPPGSFNPNTGSVRGQ